MKVPPIATVHGIDRFRCNRSILISEYGAVDNG
jgi:hypothetical protein